MRLQDLAKYLIRSANNADKLMAREFKTSVQTFIEELRELAPIDSGDFKDSWGSDGVSSSIKGLRSVVSNEKVYASAIEFGSTPGEKPWPNPGPKTVMSSGRIFSTQAVGGTIDKAFNDAKMEMFAERLASAILRAFK